MLALTSVMLVLFMCGDGRSVGQCHFYTREGEGAAHLGSGNGR